MSIEMMKQWLAALEHTSPLIDDVITAKASLRQAIEQAEKQEPVGVVGMDVSRPHMRSLDGQYFGQKPDTKTAMLFKDLEVGTKLYTTPQPQEFVCSTGLCHYKTAAQREAVFATEAKLMQKNGYVKEKS